MNPGLNPTNMAALNAFSMGRGFDPLLALLPNALPAVPLAPSLEGSSSA